MTTQSLMLLIAVPLLAGLAVLVLPARAARVTRLVTLLSGLTTLALSIYLLTLPTVHDEFWPFGLSSIWGLTLTYNGLTGSLILLTAIVYTTAVTTSWKRVKMGVSGFHGLLSLLVAGVFGVFLTDHILYFFLFYELAVLPMYLLIGIWGSTKPIPGAGPFGDLYGKLGVGTRGYGALKLTLYLLVGSALLLGGIFGLMQLHERTFGFASFSMNRLSMVQASSDVRLILFMLFYVGFGSLAGIWPFHTWSPDGHAAAPPAASMMHAGVLMKLGAFGVMRVGMVLMPQAATEWAWVVGTIAIINILYGALAALWQTDIKYLIAYSSVSHMGVVMLGVATMNPAGWSGATFQMVSHGLMTALFFTLVGILYDETHERQIDKLHGLARHMPGLTAIWMLAVLSSLGLPGLSGFVAELYTFVGAWQRNIGWAIAGAFGAWLTAVYLLRVARFAFFRGEPTMHGSDLRGIDWVTPVVLGGALVLFGLWPRLLLDHIEPQVQLWFATMGGVR